MIIVELLDHPQHVQAVIGHMRATWPKVEVEVEGDLAAAEVRLCGARERNVLPVALLALSEGRLAGFISLIHLEVPTTPGHSHWIDALFVVPEHRGAGLGSQLIQAGLRKAVSLGLDSLCAYTDRIGLYRRNGFKPLAPAGGATTIVMQKYL